MASQFHDDSPTHYFWDALGRARIVLAVAEYSCTSTDANLKKLEKQVALYLKAGPITKGIDDLQAFLKKYYAMKVNLPKMKSKGVDGAAAILAEWVADYKWPSGKGLGAMDLVAVERNRLEGMGNKQRND